MHPTAPKYRSYPPGSREGISVPNSIRNPCARTENITNLPEAEALASYIRLLKSASGPEIEDVWGLSGPLLPQNPLEKVGGEAPHFSQWVLQ